MKIKLAFRYTTPLLLILFIVACASSNLKDAEHAYNSGTMRHGHNSGNINKNKHDSHASFYGKKENAVTQTSEKKHFKVSLFCNESPIPMSKIHDWTIHIETPDGKPVENAKVFIFGGMPMHNHEFPTVPIVKEYLGNGDYRIEGIKFSMIGHWEMHFNIEHEQKSDHVEFKIHM